MNKTANVLLISNCETLTEQIEAAFRNSDVILDCHCLKNLLDDDISIRVDIAILDMGFQTRQGLSLLKHIKARLPEVPVIVLAEEGSGDQVINAFRLGARDYFRKPVNLFLFRETILRLMKVKKTSHERRRSLSERRSDLPETQKMADMRMPLSILRAMVFMTDNLAESLTLASIAAAAGMTKHHFCRSFKKHTGMTPMQSLASLRVERAKSLLGTTSYAISMVAAEAGFGDLSSFMRCFKKLTGVTASDFRNSSISYDSDSK